MCAIDGTTMFAPASATNVGRFGRQTGTHGGSGYPLLRLVAVVACGTRTIIDAVFGPLSVGETSMAPRLLRCLRSGMVLLADRNFAVRDLIGQIADTGAHVVIRCKDDRKLPPVRRLGDGSWLSVLGAVTVRVLDAEITVTCEQTTRVVRYRLITTLTDPKAFPALELMRLYHLRWEIETTYLELKSTILGGRVLRARTPEGITQEVYALLATYQALRLAMADATDSDPAVAPDRASFTVALHAARDQIIHAAGVLAGTTVDLVGRIGRAVLADLLPKRRMRISPRVVKRAISKHRAKGTIDRTNHHARIDVKIISTADLTTGPGP